VFGHASASSLRWTADTVLSEAPSFYLNPYLRHHNFFFLRFKLSIYLQEVQQLQTARQEAQAANEMCRKRHKVGKK